MNGISKPQSLEEVKFLIGNFGDALSDDNIKIITAIIDEIENAGGLDKADPSQLEQLILLLAQQNDIDLSEL
ncbi:hypothetical protein [Selenihalanaerobacter shriftii]|uniref:Uncharacterized protein n=1 Tax=Selenihalanaerobacter shriftii TaxID=142842 RepID=A0A1T4QTV5_9FIRM|nr:hypothetical protein [Selenihalanaerobacter shriftii]SKA06708.1 hypothetical protein SAMN02745118_02677 [Selenihalanaerobacter shriftii]